MPSIRSTIDNLKNLPGWRSSEKLVVFCVDDYGNVRLASRNARDRLDAAGVPLTGRFDHLDAFETREDLEALFEVLASVKDRDGRYATFTPYVLSANPDFDAMALNAREYRYETLPETFERLASEHPSSYEGTWKAWRAGIAVGLLRPQFHGREHLNVSVIEQKLRAADHAMAANIRNRSMAGLTDDPAMPGVGFTHAFGVSSRIQVAAHREIIADGMNLFERVFGCRSTTFTPPAQKIHPDLYPFVEGLGVRSIDKPLYHRQRVDTARSVRQANVLGRRRGQGHVTIVRNVVFEPNDGQFPNAVALALRQIEMAFRWRKPAIISSHRVNFCGHIDEGNRKFGLAALRELLDAIVTRWPDVRFIGADELVERITATS